MAGLLGGALDNDLTRFGLGLLAASGPTNDPQKGAFGNRMMQAVGSFDDYRQQQSAKARQQMEMERAKQMQEFQAFQMQAMKDQVAKQAAAEAAAQRQQAAIPGLFRAQQTQGEISIPQMGGMDMFSQGANVDAPSMRGPTGFDVQGALALGLNPDQIEKYSKLTSIGKPKVARTIKGTGPDGREYEYLLDESGERIGEGFGQFRAPIEMGLGDKKQMLDPYTLQPKASFAMGMSPADKDASARGWASVNQSGERLKMDKDKIAAESANGGYSTKPLPASALKMQNEALDAVNTAAGINKQLANVSTQIDTGKLSFGPVSNLANSALNATGISTEESRNFASFKSTLEKLRNDSLRLNTGVQTDGDAQRAWNELFQNINDTGLVKQRLQEISAINKRAEELQRLKVDQIRGNYNAAPMDYTKMQGAPSGVSSGGTSGGWGIQRVN